MYSTVQYNTEYNLPKLAITFRCVQLHSVSQGKGVHLKAVELIQFIHQASNMMPPHLDFSHTGT